MSFIILIRSHLFQCLNVCHNVVYNSIKSFSLSKSKNLAKYALPSFNALLSFVALLFFCSWFSLFLFNACVFPYSHKILQNIASTLGTNKPQPQPSTFLPFLFVPVLFWCFLLYFQACRSSKCSNL